MLPRSLSAAAQSCASKPRLAPLLFACFAIQSPPVSCNEGSALPAGCSYSSTGFAEMTAGRACPVTAWALHDAARGCVRAVCCRQVRHRDLRTTPRQPSARLPFVDSIDYEIGAGKIAICDSSNHLRAPRPAE